MQPGSSPQGEEEKALKSTNRSDHTVSHRHRLSLRSYPRDCPPIRPCWFHAVDVPKRRPLSIAHNTAEAKPPAQPKKYAAFSARDSKAIEAAFQKLVEEEEAHERSRSDSSSREETHQQKWETAASNIKSQRHKTCVPVNEDYLFDVNVEERELAPAYWLGPIYDVRRGTWFYQDGNVQRPCDENLAAQLEEGYLKTKAWTFKPDVSGRPRQKSTSGTQSRPASWALDEQNVQKVSLNDDSTAPLEGTTQILGKVVEGASKADIEKEAPTNSYRLFGAHMNSVVTYQDANTAWLMTDDFLSRMNYTMYQRFAGGGHFAGVKLTRGYVGGDNKKPGIESEEVSTGEDDIPTAGKPTVSDEASTDKSTPKPVESRRQTLARQMSALLEDVHESPEKQEKERQRRDEREIKNDYREIEGDEQGRDIDHLILVTHGIGQRLGLRLESVNFVHDVNAFRKTLKTVYTDSPDLRALNAELGNLSTVNSRIQVLPICWRHLLDFPKRSIKQKRKEHDIDIVDSDIDDAELPSLDDITVEGVPAVRNLVTDLALDILLYQSAVYKDHISRIVLSECNRIYQLFKQRNPQFEGRVSLVGHSLGSAIMFDILCKQEPKPVTGVKNHHSHHRHKHDDFALDFEVADFYALGSPIGLFQMLNGQTIASRKQPAARVHNNSSMDDPMLVDPLSAPYQKNAVRNNFLEITSDVAVSRPKCAQIFNIFHPTDPIAYRIEPMISSAMASLKPQPLPYTKRGIFGGPVGQGISGIGNRVTQSVSSMWSSVASNLLTRGLGYAGDNNGKVSNSQNKTSSPLSFMAGKSSSSPSVQSGVSRNLPKLQENQHMPADQLADPVGSNPGSRHPPTLIDNELETLYDGFQKRRNSAAENKLQASSDGEAVEGSPEWLEAEERRAKLRREEQKVRLLNSNGRVDYAIQEGVFDINLIAAVASHLSYWTDEDVSHFMISQILSRYRSTGTRKS